MATSVPASIPRTTEGNVTTAGNTDTSFETHEDIKIPKQETKNIVKIDSGKTYDDIKVDKTLNLDKIQERSTENLNVTKTDTIEKVSSPDHVLKSFPGSVPKSANLLDKVATRVRSPEKTGSALDSSISEKVNVKAGLGSRWRHSTNDCLACVKTRPPSSHELREAFFAGTMFILKPQNIIVT